MALPTFVAAGAPASGTGNITPPLPAGFLANDILLMFIETANQAVTIPTGWANVTGSPQGVGTVGGSSSTMLTILWKRAVASETTPTITDPGDHALGFIAAFRGCIGVNNPWDVTSTVTDAVSSTSFTIPGATTTRPDCLVVLACALHLDGVAPRVNSWTNASLANIQIRADNSTTAGNKGSLGMATGELATPSTYGSTSVALSSTQIKAGMTIALRPSNFSLSMTGGNYNEFGTTSSVIGNRSLGATAGVETLSGSISAPRAAHTSFASSGSFQSVGMTSSPLATRRIAAQPGSQFHTGASSFTFASRSLAASSGSGLSSGVASSLLRNSRMLAAAGSQSLLGSSASLLLLRRLLATPGSGLSSGTTSQMFRRALLAVQSGSMFSDGVTAGLAFGISSHIQIIRGRRAQLYSTIALGDFTVTVPPGSPTTIPPSNGLIIPIPRSWPNQDIGISRVICRIHLLGVRLAGMYATTLFLARASDGSLLGGVATDIVNLLSQINSNLQKDEVLGDREFNHEPNYFKLGRDDSLVANFRTFDDIRFGDYRLIRDIFFSAKIDILFSYVLLDSNGIPL